MAARYGDFCPKLSNIFSTHWDRGVAGDHPSYCWAEAGYALDRSSDCHIANRAGAIEPAMLASHPVDSRASSATQGRAL